MDIHLFSTDCEAVSRNVFIVKHFRDDLYKYCFLKRKRNLGFEQSLQQDELDRKYQNKEYIPKLIYDDEFPIPSKISYVKIAASLSRSKRLVRELALCNDWQYFFTGTIDKDKLDRFDLMAYSAKFRKFINNYNFRKPEYKVSYILIPEQHKNGAWHVHGLISGIDPKDFVFNKNGYLVWKQYDDTFGYMSLSRVRDKERVASYITKYISKSLGSCIAKGFRSFYHSNGLKRPEKIAEFSNVDEALINSLNWDFEQEEGYCKVKMTRDIQEINNLGLFLGGQPLVMVGGALSKEDKHDFLNVGFEPIYDEE